MMQGDFSFMVGQKNIRFSDFSSVLALEPTMISLAMCFLSRMVESRYRKQLMTGCRHPAAAFR